MSRAQRGQSTVEFAIVAVVFLAVSLGLSAIARHFIEGGPVAAASRNAPYVLEVSIDAARRLAMF